MSSIPDIIGYPKVHQALPFSSTAVRYVIVIRKKTHYIDFSSEYRYDNDVDIKLCCLGMKMAFQHFDHDGNGCITAIELQTILKNLGMEASLNESQELVEKFDTDGMMIL